MVGIMIWPCPRHPDREVQGVLWGEQNGKSKSLEDLIDPGMKLKLSYINSEQRNASVSDIIITSFIKMRVLSLNRFGSVDSWPTD